MTLAKQMILSAKENGAGLVKSQLFNAEDDRGKPHYEWVKKAELTFDQAKELFDYGAEIGIEVFFSVFGVQYVEWCEKIGVKRYKIACQFRNGLTLQAIKNTGRPVFISTKNLFGNFPSNWEFLYCVPDYPATIHHFDEIDFNCLYTGFSDHSLNMSASYMAVARGAKVIERHFTLNRNLPGPDQIISMTPSELIGLVSFDKDCEAMRC